jgi:hypothetical protein
MNGGGKMRLNKRENVWMRKLNTWIPESELEAIRRVKGDISVSLFVRRAIKKVLSAEGEQGTNQTPKAAFVPNVHTEDVVKTTTTLASKREVEAL